MFSNSTVDPLVVLFEYNRARQQLVYVDQTEWQQNTLNPDFIKRVTLLHKPNTGENKQMRFTIYDVDSSDEVKEEDCMGWVDINFNDLLNAPDQDLAYRMVNVTDPVRNQLLESNQATMFLRYESGRGDTTMITDQTTFDDRSRFAGSLLSILYFFEFPISLSSRSHSKSKSKSKSKKSKSKSHSKERSTSKRSKTTSSINFDLNDSLDLGSEHGSQLHSDLDLSTNADFTWKDDD